MIPWPTLLCAGAAGTKLCAGRVWSILTLHVGPDQPDPITSPYPNPNPNPNPYPLIPTPTRWGVRSRQGQPRRSAACLGGVFQKNLRATERPASTNRPAQPAQSFVPFALAHMGRVRLLAYGVYVLLYRTCGGVAAVLLVFCLLCCMILILSATILCPRTTLAWWLGVFEVLLLGFDTKVLIWREKCTWRWIVFF